MFMSLGQEINIASPLFYCLFIMLTYTRKHKDEVKQHTPSKLIKQGTGGRKWT